MATKKTARKTAKKTSKKTPAKKIGRPKTLEGTVQFFNFGMTEANKAKLARLAKKRAVGMAECIRQLITETKA